MPADSGRQPEAHPSAAAGRSGSATASRSSTRRPGVPPHAAGRRRARESPVGAGRMSETVFKRKTLDQLCKVPDGHHRRLRRRAPHLGGRRFLGGEEGPQARTQDGAGLPDRPGPPAPQRRPAAACRPVQPGRQDEPHRPGLVGSGRVRLGQVAPALVHRRARPGRQGGLGDRPAEGDEGQKGKREIDLPVLRERPRQEVQRQVEGDLRGGQDPGRPGRRHHRRHATRAGS